MAKTNKEGNKTDLSHISSPEHGTSIKRTLETQEAFQDTYHM